MTHVIVRGKVMNVESGLWYGFVSATNLTESFEAVPNATMSTTSGDHLFSHDFQIEKGDTVRFFKFRVSDDPPAVRGYAR